MKWYQHESTAHNDELMRDLIHRFGVEGYGVYHIILELISEKIDDKTDAKIRISEKVLREKLRLSHQKVTKILRFLHQNSVVFSIYKSKYWIIECPNLLKRLDNWTKRSVVPTKQVSLQSEREREREVDQEGKQSKNRVLNFSNDQLQTLTSKVSEVMGTGITSEATKHSVDHVMNQIKKTMRKTNLENPFGYALSVAENLNQPKKEKEKE